MPTGLEMMDMMIKGDIPPPTMAEHVNMTVTHAQNGRVMFEAVADKTHLNPMGGVHGGFAATVLDSACGCAVISSLPEGKAFTTVDIAIKMMRPIPQNETVYCEGTVQKTGRKIAFVEASLKTKDGKLLAHATSSCAILDL